MILKDPSFDNPKDNLLYDDILLRVAEDGQAGEVLRFWESKALFVVLGRVSKVEDDVNLEATRKDNIPVLRRSSGGGTVLQGKGCLNYSLILSKKHTPQISDLRRSYQFILEKLTEAFKDLNIETEFFPISDIALFSNKKKISGNAQRRMRHFILHHGTILYDFDLPLIEKYLKMPKSIPAYRGHRPHLDFVDNVRVNIDDFKKELKKRFNIKSEEHDLSKVEREYLSIACELKA